MRISLALFLGLVEAGPSSGVQKVLKLLSGLKNTVESETAQSEKDQEEYSDWCIKVTTELESAVKYGQEKVEEYAAGQESNNAKAAGHANEVSNLEPQIGKLGEDQAAAGKVRKEEHNNFVKEEAELVEADAMLKKAYAVLKRSLSFAQSGKASHNEYVEEVVQALGSIIAATGNTDNGKKIAALLEMDDSMTIRQPQATTKNYESKSGGILDVIQKMQDENASHLGSIREAEMKARHAFEMVMQDMKNQQQTMEAQVDSNNAEGAKADAAANQAGADLATAQDNLSSDESDLSAKKAGCKKAAKEFTERQASATEEVAAITKAMDVLNAKFGSFLQVSSEAGNFHERQEASSLLRQLGHSFNSFALIQAADSAQSDPFVKVRGMVKEMILKLEEESAKEAGKEAKCKADIAKGGKDQKNRQAEVNKLSTRSDAATAKFAKLGEEIATLNDQLQDQAQKFAEATQLRAKQKADNEAVIKDSAESVEAINAAIGVLSEVYGKTSFLQQPKSEAGGVIIEILQTSQEDFEKIRQETEALEKELAGDYAQEKQAIQVSKAKKQAMVQGKTQEQGSLKVQLNQIGEDLAEANKALDASVTFLKTRKDECSSKAMSYEERKKKREEEIAGLNQALEILSADSESFLQVGFMARK